MEKNDTGTLVKNSKAYFNYFLSDFTEVGLELVGTEIKSIRQHGASLSDAYIVEKGGEMFVLNMHIALYDKGNIFNHDPLRTRKLLLHKREILKLSQRIKEKGFTLVPTRLYMTRGRAKLEIALGKGKNNYDKREVMKERDVKRTVDRAMKSKQTEE